MKGTIISMLVVLVILAVLPIIFLGDNDIMDTLGLGGMGKSDSIATLRAKAPKNITNVTTDKEVKMYKWVDSHGVLQFTQTPPPDGGAMEMTLKPDLNTMQAAKMPVSDEPEAKPEAGLSASGNPYSVDGVQQILKQAGDVSKLMQQQQSNQQQTIDGILGKQ